MRIIDLIKNGILYIAMLLLAILLTLVFVQIVARNIFSSSFTFIEELAMFLLSWCAFLSATYALRRKAHVAVDYFYNKFPVTMQRKVYLLTMVIILSFLIFTMYHGWQLANRQMMIMTPVLSIPRGWLFLSLPVSCLFMSIFVVDDIMKAWRGNLPKYEEEYK